MGEKYKYFNVKLAKTFSVHINEVPIPKGAVYCKISPNTYIYISNFGQFEQRRSAYECFRMDTRSVRPTFHHAYIIESDACFNSIVRFIIDNIKVGIASNCEHRKRGHIVGTPYEKKNAVPTPMRTKPKCENIDWEYKVQLMADADGYAYNGMCNTWNEIQGAHKISITPFEGVTDTDVAKRKDGMKVKQTAIRPERDGVKGIKNYTGKKTTNEKNQKVVSEKHNVYPTRRYSATLERAKSIQSIR